MKKAAQLSIVWKIIIVFLQNIKICKLFNPVYSVLCFNDELCNANRKYLSKSAKFLQSAHMYALCLFSIQHETKR